MDSFRSGTRWILEHPRVNLVFGLMGVAVSLFVACRFLHPDVAATGQTLPVSPKPGHKV